MQALAASWERLPEMASPTADRHVAAPLVREAAAEDAEAMLQVEQAAHALLRAQGVDLSTLRVPPGWVEPTSWTLAFVVEIGSQVVGMARLTEATGQIICLDQVSVRPAFAGRGLGTLLLTEVAAQVRQRGYRSITGTTFRDVAFNAPFYRRLGCTEDEDPPAVMLRRRRVEQDLGLDQFGPRVILRLHL